MVTKLNKVKIKDIWKTEDKDFTPWLVENINLLNEDIGLNIQDPKRESRLLNFIVDIVAEDEEGKVIIENQFNSFYFCFTGCGLWWTGICWLFGSVEIFLNSN